MQEAARPVTVGTRVVAATRGWLLPYLVIAIIVVVELFASHLIARQNFPHGLKGLMAERFGTSTTARLG